MQDAQIDIPDVLRSPPAGDDRQGGTVSEIDLDSAADARSGDAGACPERNALHGVDVDDFSIHTQFHSCWTRFAGQTGLVRNPASGDAGRNRRVDADATGEP